MFASLRIVDHELDNGPGLAITASKDLDRRRGLLEAQPLSRHSRFRMDQTGSLLSLSGMSSFDPGKASMYHGGSTKRSGSGSSSADQEFNLQASSVSQPATNLGFFCRRTTSKYEDIYDIHSQKTKMKKAPAVHGLRNFLSNRYVLRQRGPHLGIRFPEATRPYASRLPKSSRRSSRPTWRSYLARRERNPRRTCKWNHNRNRSRAHLANDIRGFSGPHWLRPTGDRLALGGILDQPKPCGSASDQVVFDRLRGAAATDYGQRTDIVSVPWPSPLGRQLDSATGSPVRSVRGGRLNVLGRSAVGILSLLNFTTSTGAPTYTYWTTMLPGANSPAGLTIDVPFELAWSTVTLEAYNVISLESYPPGSTTFRNISLQMEDGSVPKPPQQTWSIQNDWMDGFQTTVEVDSFTEGVVIIDYPISESS
uniref:Uncharacterized protein n=1 Tax=Mycena chlorophos TaxID=658473 RepID=A0ABQ0M479_MYCCL|nr:predicted protein [Mycena chlorophos]